MCDDRDDLLHLLRGAELRTVTLASAILAWLQAAGVNLKVEGDRLIVNDPQEALDDDDLAFLSAQKHDLLAHLAGEPIPWVTCDWRAVQRLVNEQAEQAWYAARRVAKTQVATKRATSKKRPAATR
jgi:hypothetical protein